MNLKNDKMRALFSLAIVFLSYYFFSFAESWGFTFFLEEHFPCLFNDIFGLHCWEIAAPLLMIVSFVLGVWFLGCFFRIIYKISGEKSVINIVGIFLIFLGVFFSRNIGEIWFSFSALIAIFFVGAYLLYKNIGSFEKVESFFRSGYFFGIRIFVLVFLFYVFLSSQGTNMNVYGQIIEKSLLDDFVFSYLSFSAGFFRPFQEIGMLFLGEKPLNPFGFFLSSAIFSFVVGFLFDRFLKLIKRGKENEKRRALLFTIIDTAFFFIAYIIVALPFVFELDFF